MTKAPKKGSLAWHKKQAWDQFSIYIRTRDCLMTSGALGIGSCVTCNRPYNFKQLQAGHWIPGRNNAVLFSERGVHAQCDSCNRHLKGNPIKYWLFMEQAYGRKIMDELMAESKTSIQYKIHDFEAIALKYAKKTTDLITGAMLAQLDRSLDQELPF